MKRRPTVAGTSTPEVIHINDPSTSGSSLGVVIPGGTLPSPSTTLPEAVMLRLKERMSPHASALHPRGASYRSVRYVSAGAAALSPAPPASSQLPPPPSQCSFTSSRSVSALLPSSPTPTPESASLTGMITKSSKQAGVLVSASSSTPPATTTTTTPLGSTWLMQLHTSPAELGNKSTPNVMQHRRRFVELRRSMWISRRKELTAELQRWETGGGGGGGSSGITEHLHRPGKSSSTSASYPTLARLSTLYHPSGPLEASLVPTEFLNSIDGLLAPMKSVSSGSEVGEGGELDKAISTTDAAKGVPSLGTSSSTQLLPTLSFAQRMAWSTRYPMPFRAWEHQGGPWHPDGMPSVVPPGAARWLRVVQRQDLFDRAVDIIMNDGTTSVSSSSTATNRGGSEQVVDRRKEKDNSNDVLDRLVGFVMGDDAGRGRKEEGTDDHDDATMAAENDSTQRMPQEDVNPAPQGEHGEATIATSSSLRAAASAKDLLLAELFGYGNDDGNDNDDNLHHRPLNDRKGEEGGDPYLGRRRSKRDRSPTGTSGADRTTAPTQREQVLRAPAWAAGWWSRGVTSDSGEATTTTKKASTANDMLSVAQLSALAMRSEGATRRQDDMQKMQFGDRADAAVLRLRLDGERRAKDAQAKKFALKAADDEH